MTPLSTRLHKNAPLVAWAAAVLVLAAAFGFEAQGYQPCEMCWWQRYPYMAVAVIAPLLILIKRASWPKGRLLLALLFAATSMIGLFHWGVENGWWDGPATCTAALDLSGDTEAALDAILNAPVIRCDQVSWSLLGLSMAGYNMLIGAGLAAFMVWSAATPLNRIAP